MNHTKRNLQHKIKNTTHNTKPEAERCVPTKSKPQNMKKRQESPPKRKTSTENPTGNRMLYIHILVTVFHRACSPACHPAWATPFSSSHSAVPATFRSSPPPRPSTAAPRPLMDPCRSYQTGTPGSPAGTNLREYASPLSTGGIQRLSKVLQPRAEKELHLKGEFSQGCQRRNPRTRGSRTSRPELETKRNTTTPTTVRHPERSQQTFSIGH